MIQAEKDNTIIGNDVHINSGFGFASQSNKPRLEVLWKNYNTNGQNVIKEVGGKLTQFKNQNTCAIKLSHALNLSGKKFPLQHYYLGI